MHERKYKILDNRIVKRAGEKPVLEDEPLFILRAQDRKALLALSYYIATLDTLDHKASVMLSIEDFRRFAEQNPERMKEPD